MHIAILTFQRFNELDSFIALRILNRIRKPGAYCRAAAAPTRQLILATTVSRHRIAKPQWIAPRKLEMVAP